STASESRSRTIGLLLSEIPTALLFVLLVAAWLPGTAGWALLGTVAALIGGRVWGRRRPSRSAIGFAPRWANAGNCVRELFAEQRDPRPQSTTERWQQRLRRWQTADDVDTLEAKLRVEFVDGQRHANVHVACCPPFSQLPDVTFEQ